MNTKVAFITGGSKGIGLGIAEVLIKENIKVVITGRDEFFLNQAFVHLNTISKGNVLGINADVRSLSEMASAVEKAVAKFGRIDYLIANAGVAYMENIESLSPQQWNDTIDVNLTGVFNTVKTALSQIKANKGYIITIASLAGTNFFVNGTAYNASKFGLVGFTQALMLDLRPAGVKVSTIMPGSVTSYLGGHTPSDADHWKIQPEDIGQIVSDLIKMPSRTLPSKIEVRPSQTK